MAALLARLLQLIGPFAMILALLGLGACGNLAATLPARPTPVPTLARLPSVTPVTPQPTALPSATAVPAVTPTALVLSGSVARNANVRAGPGVGFAIVGVQNAGATVTLSGRSGPWYRVRTADGTEGWMASQVLTVDATVSAAVPEVAP